MQQTPMTALACESLTVEDLRAQADLAHRVLKLMKDNVLSPLGEKAPPRYTAAQLQKMLGLTKQAFATRIKDGRFPPGEAPESASGRLRRTFGVADVRAMRAAEGLAFKRPEGCDAFIVASANLKGGVGKTTLAVSLAEGLALDGADVLVIDLDPQGTATTLLGFIPDAEIEPEHTFLACIPGAFDETLPVIDSLELETYWPGVHLVPAAISLSEADQHLPAMSERDAAAQFYAVLDNALTSARKRYDVIVLDIPPSLSYLTHNAIYSATGLLLPLPPNYLDYASMASFWRLFSDTAIYISEHSGRPSSYEYDFCRIVPNKVRAPTHPLTLQMMNWMRQTYGAKVTPSAIPYTAMAERAAVMAMGTLYDLDATGGPARAAFDALLAEIKTLIERAWGRRLAAANERAASTSLEVAA